MNVALWSGRPIVEIAGSHGVFDLHFLSGRPDALTIIHHFDSRIQPSLVS